MSDEVPPDQIEQMFAARERGEYKQPVEYKAPTAAIDSINGDFWRSGSATTHKGKSIKSLKPTKQADRDHHDPSATDAWDDVSEWVDMPRARAAAAPISSAELRKQLKLLEDHIETVTSTMNAEFDRMTDRMDEIHEVVRKLRRALE